MLNFFFNRHCNPSGFWPVQLSLSILSRKAFTECRCQRHVKPPNLEDQRLELSNSRYQVSPTPETTRANPSSGRWDCRREIAENFAESGDFHINLRHATDGFTYLPKEGALRIISPEKSDGLGRVWTRDLGYQRPARLPLDHRSLNNPSEYRILQCFCTKNRRRYIGYFSVCILHFKINISVSTEKITERGTS